MPADSEFDRSFVETFAIPEFRTIGSGSSEACSKIIGILSSYKDFPEETASRLLSNDVLIERLRATKDDIEFKQVIESAIVEENTALVEEKAILALQLEKERIETAKRDSILSELENQHKQERERAEQAESETVQAQSRAREMIEEERRKAYQAQLEIEQERNARAQAEKSAITANEEAKKAKDKLELIIRIIITFVASIITITIFEWLIVHHPWVWLLNHPNNIIIQVCIDVLIITFYIGLFIPRVRKWWWGTALFGLLLAIVSLMKM